MPKRSIEEKINYFESKIKKLRKKGKPVTPPRRSRLIIYSDSSGEDKSDNEIITSEDIISPTDINETVSELPNPTESNEPVPVPIDSDFLSALGDSNADTPKYGETIHQTLAERWLPILTRGILKEQKEKLLNEYKIPENCKLLRAPVLNPEISAALTESTRSRDKKIETQQEQLGLGITAISRALNILVTNKEANKENVQVVKILSDSCRILTDLHHTETRSRINLITPALDKSFTSIIQDLERDEILFSSKLSEKIKASKAIEKQGLQIKKSTMTQKSTPQGSSQPATASRPRYQGNWTAPFRSPSNRGGRGGAQRNPSSASSRAPASTQPRNSKQQRRAPRQ